MHYRLAPTSMTLNRCSNFRNLADARWLDGADSCASLKIKKNRVIFRVSIKQESPAIADKPVRRESLPKLFQFDVPTTLSLTILAYLHAFNCYCIRNPEKFTENSNLWSSRSYKVIDIGVNRKLICNFLLVINSNWRFSRYLGIYL